MKSNNFALFLMLFLLSSPINSSRSNSLYMRLESRGGDDKGKKVKEADKTSPILTKIKAGVAKLQKSKAFNFIYGILDKILRMSGNPIADAVFCIIDSIKMYIALRKKRAEEKKAADEEVTRADVVDLAEVSKEDPKDNEETNTDEAIKDLNELVIPDEEKEPDLANEELETIKDELAKPENDPNLVKDGDKKKNAFVRFFNKAKKGLKNSMKKTKQKLKEKYKKMKEYFPLLGKIEKLISSMIRSPLFQAALEGIICIIPQIMAVAIDGSSLFASIFSGSLVVSLLKTAPAAFKTIVKAIRSIYDTSKNPKITEATEKWEKYGNAIGEIILVVIKGLIGKVSKPCDCPK